MLVWIQWKPLLKYEVVGRRSKWLFSRCKLSLGAYLQKKIWHLEGLYWKGWMLFVSCVAKVEKRRTLGTCSTTWEVWSKVYRWFGMTSVVPSTIDSLFQGFLLLLLLFRNRKHALKGVILIWHAVIWVLWRTRNKISFRGIVVGPEEIFIESKWSHGNGYLPRRLIHHVYFMSGMLSCLIV
jgi:hypothetical protein